MWKLLIKQYFNSKSVLFAHILMFLIGLFAVVNGKMYLDIRHEQAAQLQQFHKEHSSKLVAFNKKELGSLMYYYRFALVDPPQPITALNIGQRQSQSDIQYLTIRGLQAQMYDTDFENPFNAATGFFDLGFVVLFLFPLLVIVNCFNLYAEEREMGTWRMLKVATSGPHLLVLKKWLIRMVSSLVLLLAIAFSAVPIVTINLNAAFFNFLGIASFYLLWWYLFAGWVASFQKSGTTTAAVLLSCWIAFTMLLPAFFNAYLENRYPVPEAYATALKQRDGYHRKWDLPKEQTMEPFFKKHPSYKIYPVPDQTFSWFWYYAMWQVGDDEAEEEAKGIRLKLQQRMNWQATAALFFPTILVQSEFDRTTSSDLNHYLSFLDKTKVFHDQLKQEYFPQIIRDVKVDSIDWEKTPPQFIQHQPFEWSPKPYLTLLIASLALIIAFLFTIKRHQDA